MQCPKCGWNNPDDATKCANCSADLRAPEQPQQPQQPTQPEQPQQQPYQQQPAYQQPQPYQQPYAVAARPAANYMIWSVINVVLAVPFCNLFTLVLGIIGIVKSSSTNNRNAAGDYVGAQSDATVALGTQHHRLGASGSPGVLLDDVLDRVLQGHQPGNALPGFPRLEGAFLNHVPLEMWME